MKKNKKALAISFCLSMAVIGFIAPTTQANASQVQVINNSSNRCISVAFIGNIGMFSHVSSNAKTRYEDDGRTEYLVLPPSASAAINYDFQKSYRLFVNNSQAIEAPVTANTCFPVDKNNVEGAGEYHMNFGENGKANLSSVQVAGTLRVQVLADGTIILV
jgi:hypothetical protein